jgi:hypothetical protein
MSRWGADSADPSGFFQPLCAKARRLLRRFFFWATFCLDSSLFA